MSIITINPNFDPASYKQEVCICCLKQFSPTEGGKHRNYPALICDPCFGKHDCDMDWEESQVDEFITETRKNYHYHGDSDFED